MVLRMKRTHVYNHLILNKENMLLDSTFLFKIKIIFVTYEYTNLIFNKILNYFLGTPTLKQYM